MRSAILSLLILLVASGLVVDRSLMASEAVPIPDILSGSWKLDVKGSQHHTITTATIHFTNETAESCLGGDWKRVVVDSYRSSNDDFFPITDALSYQIMQDKIVIGRNQVCDAYHHLRGELNAPVMNGDYVLFGWGEKKRGHFSLRPDSE